MRDWQVRLRIDIIHAAGRVFVEGASTPSLNLEILRDVRFVIPTDVTKEMKSVLRK